jgi:hypothetical protein
MIKRMKTAPIDKTIVIVTRAAAHQAAWDNDPRFENFWSETANRALTKKETLGWMTQSEWREFVRYEEKA